MAMDQGTSRREFLGTLAAFSLFPLEQEKPDLILHNGNILAVNDRGPHAQAVAIVRDRFLAVGSDSEVMNLASAATKKIDLGGKTVSPGFIDAHAHPAEAGLMHLRMVDCDRRSISAIQAALRERAAKTPPGEWVLGFKYDDTKTEEGRPLTAADLDAAVADHPVHIQHRGGHTVYVNSLGFRMAGVDEKTPDPPDGAIKLICDGSISVRTARLSTPYEGRPNDYGILVMTEEELYAHGRKAHLAGWQIATHANGDVAIDTTMRVYERLQKESPCRDPLFRLVSCTVVNDSLLARFKARVAIPTAV